MLFAVIRYISRANGVNSHTVLHFDTNSGKLKADYQFFGWELLKMSVVSVVTGH